MDLTYDATKIGAREITILPHQRAEHKARKLKAIYPDAIDYIPTKIPVTNASMSADVTLRKNTS